MDLQCAQNRYDGETSNIEQRKERIGLEIEVVETWKPLKQVASDTRRGGDDEMDAHLGHIGG